MKLSQQFNLQKSEIWQPGQTQMLLNNLVNRNDSMKGSEAPGSGSGGPEKEDNGDNGFQSQLSQYMQKSLNEDLQSLSSREF